MTQEEKDLLLTDLCARLPYPPICHIVGENGAEIDDILTTSTIQNLDVWVVKPYLRPMLSMTQEEIKELGEVTLKGKMQGGLYAMLCPTHAPFDWLNAHHFDYRGLIEKGLAIEVTEDNNPYKD